MGFSFFNKEFANFENYEKTSEDFLESIRSASNNFSDLLNILKNTKLFKSIEDDGFDIYLNEKKLNLKMNYSKKGNTNLFLNFPNIFGKGEIFDFNMCFDKSTLIKDVFDKESNKTLIEKVLNVNSFKVKTSKPLILKNGVMKFMVGIEKYKRKIENSKFDILEAEAGVSCLRNLDNSLYLGVQKILNGKNVMAGYLRLTRSLLGMNIKATTKIFNTEGGSKRKELGETKNVNDEVETKPTVIESWDDVKNVFTENISSVLDISNQIPLMFKIEGEKLFKFSYNLFFSEFNFALGKIFAMPSNRPIYDMFFLNRVNGFKENAISPQSNNQKLGGTTYISLNSKIGVKYSALSLFGFADIGANTQQSIKSSFKKLVNQSERNSCCIGKSVGVGLTLNNSLSFIYSIPLTNNLETENFTFSVDLN